MILVLKNYTIKHMANSLDFSDQTMANKMIAKKQMEVNFKFYYI